MLCNNCGTENLDGAKFCVGCGAELVAAPVYQEPVYQEPVYQEPVYQEPVYQEAPQEFFAPQEEGFAPVEAPQENKIKKLLPLIIGGAAALTLILILILTAKPYKKALNLEMDYYEGTLTQASYEKQYPKEYWEYVEDEFDVTVEERYEAYEESYDEWFGEYYEKEFGDNVKFSYKITDKKKLSDKKLKELRSDYSDYDMAKKDITKAYKLDLEVTIKGSDDKETYDGEAVVFKYKGKWYVDYLDWDED